MVMPEDNTHNQTLRHSSQAEPRSGDGKELAGFAVPNAGATPAATLVDWADRSCMWVSG